MIDPDVVYAKIGNIQRCLVRIRTVTDLDPERLADWNVQDVFVLNLQRAAQSAIDLAAHVVSAEGLGVPDSLADHFALLRDAGIISSDVARKMVGMVGFRNVAVHDYQELDLIILKNILRHNLSDFEEFYRTILAHYGLSKADLNTTDTNPSTGNRANGQ